MAHLENKLVMEALAKCAAECNHCAIACLDEENVKMMARCIRLDMDCAHICALAAGFMARGSEFTKQLLPVCAAVCEECARECDSHAQMEHCARCAQACRECAQACRDAA